MSLTCLDTFPETLLKLMLQAAVKEPDPSFNNEFIRPCRRVYGYEKPHSLLMDIFNCGTNEVKIGVLKALYWTRPTVYSFECHLDNTIEIRFGYDTFVWDDDQKYYDDEFVDDKNIYDIEGRRQEEVFKKEVQVLMDTFAKTQSTDLKYQIGLRLPKQVSSSSANCSGS
ncbi:MAG: hypothetical protein JWR72_511 [Flavisolibacter sp.]|nr:hypothetical protein [Flavisolibacter sp.]